MPAIDIVLETMSVGPEEIDDSVDLTPGGMFHHIAVYWGDVFSLRNVSTRQCFVRPGTVVQLHAVTASVSGLSTAATDPCRR